MVNDCYHVLATTHCHILRRLVEACIIVYFLTLIAAAVRVFVVNMVIMFDGYLRLIFFITQVIDIESFIFIITNVLAVIFRLLTIQLSGGFTTLE